MTEIIAWAWMLVPSLVLEGVAALLLADPPEAELPLGAAVVPPFAAATVLESCILGLLLPPLAGAVVLVPRSEPPEPAFAAVIETSTPDASVSTMTAAEGADSWPERSE